MYLYSKYIIQNVLFPAISVLVLATAVLWITQSLKFIELIITSGVDAFNFIVLSVLLLPPLVSILIPITVFISVIYTYNKLYSNHELTIFRSSGISRFSLSKPALLLAGIFIVFNYIITLYLLPVSNKEFKDRVLFFQDNYISVLLQEKVFVHPTEDLTLYIGERSKGEKLKNVFLHDNRNKDKPITIVATSGEFKKAGSKILLELTKGNRQFISENNEYSILYFDFMSFDFELGASSSAGRGLGIQETHIYKLLFPNSSIDQDRANKMKAEAHFRILWPILSLCLALFALRAIFFGEYSRHGKAKRITLYSLSSVLMIAILIGGNSLGGKYPFLIPLTYLVVLSITGYYYYSLSKSDLSSSA